MMMKKLALVLALAATPVAAAEPQAPTACCIATINAPPQVWQAIAQIANDNLPTKYGLPLLQQITKQIQPQIDAANAKLAQPKTKPTVEK